MNGDLAGAQTPDTVTGLRLRYVLAEIGCQTLTPAGQHYIQIDEDMAEAVHALNVLQVCFI